MGITYRVGQFLRSVLPRIKPDDHSRVHEILTPDLAKLFFEMNRADQMHALRVLNDLRRTGPDDPDLLAAALLHDVGKSRGSLNPLQRTVVVLTNLIAPELVNKLGREPDKRGLRKPFITAIQHPHWGAEMVEKQGGSARLAQLVRMHQDPLNSSTPPELKPLLVMLQQADNRN